MTQNLPIYISLTFVLAAIATLLLFIWAVSDAKSETIRKKSMVIFIELTIWLPIQFIFIYKNIYNTNTNFFPPKILLLGVLPAILTILLLFVNAKRLSFYR